jgi:methionyl-tRNA formyltransferase
MAKYKGEAVKFFNVSFLPVAHAADPGEILEVSPQGLKIAVNGGAVLVTRFRTKSLGKVKADEFVKAVNPQVGESFAG